MDQKNDVAAQTEDSTNMTLGSVDKRLRDRITTLQEELEELNYRNRE